MTATVLAILAIPAATVGMILAYRDGKRAGDAAGYSRGYTDAKAHAREKAALVAEESERERVARIARNRSDGARKAWRTRRGEDK